MLIVKENKPKTTFALVAENLELQERVKTLEYIITIYEDREKVGRELRASLEERIEQLEYELRKEKCHIIDINTRKVHKKGKAKD